MNPPIDHQPRPRLAFWLVMLSGTLGILLVAAGISSHFRLSRDARCLRDSFTQATHSAVVWHRKIQLNVGPFTLAAVRAGLAWAPLPPEARTALRAVRGAEVGIYEWAGDHARLDREQMLERADAAMETRGWERLAGVRHGRELVAVYVPKGGSATGSLRACVAVLDRDQLVVAAGKTELEPLLTLALNHPELRHKANRPLRL